MWNISPTISSFDRNYALKRQFHDTNADITIKPRQFLTSCNNFHSVSSLDTCAIMVYKSLVKIRLLTVIRHLRYGVRIQIMTPK